MNIALTRRREILLSTILRLVVFAIFAVIWQIGATIMQNPVLATFTEAVAGLIDLTIISRDIWEPLYVSNQAMIIGYFFGIITAIPLGLAAGRSRTLDRMADPYVAIFLAIPIAPLIPVVIVALGLGLASRVLIVYFFVFVFMVVNTRAGVRQVDDSLPEMARSFGASEAETWRMVIIPGASPAIFAGLRIGLGRAIAGMVIVELLLVASGIGRILLQAAGKLQGGRLFGIVLAVILESLILLSLMRLVERKSAAWAHDASI